MNRYSTEALSWGGVCKRALRLHYLTLKHTIFFILLITLTKYVALFMGAFWPTLWKNNAIAIGAILLIIALFSAALYSAQQAFIDKPQLTLPVLKSIWRRLPRIYAIVAVYVLGSIALHYFAWLILIAIAHLINEPSPIHGGAQILGAAFVLTFLGLFYFALPLCVIEDVSIYKAFHTSALLSENQKSAVLLLFFILGVIVLLISPVTLHEYFLATYHLDVLFDFIVLCVAVPIYINLTLLFIHEANRQRTTGTTFLERTSP